MEWYEILILVACTCVLFALSVVLVKRGILKPTDLNQVSDAVETLRPMAAEGTFFDQLLKYAQIAFHAAEQACHTGEIAPEEKGSRAMELVSELAESDGVDLSDTDMDTARTMLEAQCDVKGHAEA